MVIVEAEGGRVALLVDELLGQQQVVVKNLEANYRKVQDQTIKTIGGSGRVVEVRDEYMPVIGLEDVFQVPRFDFEHVAGIMVVVEAEGGRVALLVDELLGQQQVVVKNLEANYRKVNDVSGATIMGDGRVALILDIASLVRRSRH